MNSRVLLARPRQRREWVNSNPDYRPIVVTRTWSRWRCLRGYKIHRARHAVIYDRTKAHTRLVVEFWCGQHAQRPIPFREECAEGTEPCGRCEGLYAQAQGVSR